MTVYDARAERRRVRPTLRLRLTLVNGILLVGAAALLVVLAWLLVGDALNSRRSCCRDRRSRSPTGPRSTRGTGRRA